MCLAMVIALRILGQARAGSMLRSLNFTQPFVLQTDASDGGAGAVLSQCDSGEEHPEKSGIVLWKKNALQSSWQLRLSARVYLLGKNLQSRQIIDPWSG